MFYLSNLFLTQANLSQALFAFNLFNICRGVFDKSIVGPIKPVYDGRDSLYTIEPIPRVGETDKLKLEVTLAAPDGRERAFAVDIKFEVCLQLFL